ncbi:MAG: ClbS/DfsB family four-helix bundle protein [Anaerolineae bacterium]
MARPKTKTDLLAAMQQEHDALEQLIESIPQGQLANVSETIEQWTVKDILAHVTEWEQMCLGWYQVGLRDEVPPMPAEGFKWNQIPALNQQIYERYRLQPIEDILESFNDSYKQMHKTVKEISEEEMFTPQVYKWTRKNAMGTYFVSATSSHYGWAQKEIKKRLKSQTSSYTQL